MTFALGAKTSDSAGKTSGKTYVPQISTTSACDVIAGYAAQTCGPAYL